MSGTEANKAGGKRSWHTSRIILYVLQGISLGFIFWHYRQLQHHVEGQAVAAKLAAQASTQPSAANIPGSLPPLAPLPMPTDLHFTGNVTDAITHQPVKGFIIQIGHRMNGIPITIMDEPISIRFDASYSVAQSRWDKTGQWVVKVIAHGYLPATSPPLQESATHDFALTPAPDLVGKVLDPNGQPAGGVTITLATPGISALFHDLTTTSPACLHDETGDDGKFDLPPPGGHFLLVAMGEAGCATADQDQFAHSHEIQLAKWAAIKGHVMVGTRSASNQGVRVASSIRGANVLTEPSVSFTIDKTTDGEGNFKFDRVPAAEVSVGRVVPQMIGPNRPMRGITQLQNIVAAPGVVTTVNIGGTGRPVTGKLIIPAGMIKDHYFLRGNIWSDDGNSADRRDYVMELNDDGTYVIQDVLPADYRVIIEFYSVGNSPHVAPVLTDFTMPPIPGGRSDEPLVLPDIQLSTR